LPFPGLELREQLEAEAMKRLLLGILIGAASMYWYIEHRDEITRKVESWIEAVSRDYSVGETTGKLAGKWK